MKHKQTAAFLTSLAMLAGTVPVTAFAADDNAAFSGYVLMNIPYSDFYAAEGAAIGDVDAVSSATNKTGNYGKAGGVYHTVEFSADNYIINKVSAVYNAAEVPQGTPDPDPAETTTTTVQETTTTTASTAAAPVQAGGAATNAPAAKTGDAGVGAAAAALLLAGAAAFALKKKH